MKKVLITGSNGFIGSNLLYNLKYKDGIDVFEFNIEHDRDYLKKILREVDFVFHLAGVNRPEEVKDFKINNIELTQFIVEHLIEFKIHVPIVLASSTEANLIMTTGKVNWKLKNI